MNFSDIVQGEDGFLVELRCNNTFQVQLFGKIKAYLLENQPAWKAAGAIPSPDAVAMFNLIDSWLVEIGIGARKQDARQKMRFLNYRK